MKSKVFFSGMWAVLCMFPAWAQMPLGPEITYQASIQQSGAPLNNTADFQFRLFTAPTGGTQIGSMQAINNLTVVDGQIMVELNFGAGAFSGDKRFLEIAVRSPAGSGLFTTLTPRQPLTAAPYALYALTGPGSGGPWATSGNNIFNTNTGNVGIGTSTPSGKLDIQGANNSNVLFARRTGGGLAHNMFIDGAGNGSMQFLDSTGTPRINLGASNSTYFNYGNVGIGTTSPFFRLTTVASFPSDGIGVIGSSPNAPAFSLGASGHGTSYLGMATDTFNFSTDAAPGDLVLLSPLGKRLLLQNGNARSSLAIVAGNVGIGTNSPGAKLDVNGTTRTQVLEITGADLAEKFPASETLEAGMVVAIDARNAGKLCLSRGAYNRCVAGVVSGANNFSVGAVLGNLPGHEDAPPIALSGRVYVQCDASAGAIELGDLLTTSDVPGHAMKATDRERSHGAVIGKAMGALPAGKQGLVLVLVNLQ